MPTSASDHEILRLLGLNHWFNGVVHSLEEIPASDRSQLLTHGCHFSVASVAEIQTAKAATQYPHDRGWIVYPPGESPDCWP